MNGKLRARSQLILDLVHPNPQRHGGAIERLHPLLTDVNRGTIFEIGWRMGCILTGHGLVARDKAIRLPFESKLNILAAGSKALANWPDSLSDAVKGSALGSRSARIVIATNIGKIARAQNAWPALKEALRKAAPSLTSGAAAAVRFTLVDGANSGELARELGVNQRVFKRLRRTSDLKPARAIGHIKSHQLFEAAGLETLKRSIHDRVSVGAIAEQLDISRHGVEQLACLDQIEIYDGTAMRGGFLQRQAKKSDFDLLLEALTNSAQSLEVAGDTGFTKEALQGRTIKMHSAMKAIGGREKPWGPAVIAMLSGELPFQLDLTHGRRFMSRVQVAAADLHKIAAMRFDHSDYPQFDFERTINGRDAEELLNVNPRAWQNAKLEKAIPRPTNGLYDRNLIREIASKYISSSEILARCDRQGRKMPAPFTGPDRLINPSALGFIRKSAEVPVLAYEAKRCSHHNTK